MCLIQILHFGMFWKYFWPTVGWLHWHRNCGYRGFTVIWIYTSSASAAAATKSLQSYPTLCDPTDGSPPGSPVPGFSRQEHWSGLPFPSSLRESEVTQSCPTLSDPMDHSLQAPPSMGFSRQEYWSGVPLPSLSSASITHKHCSFQVLYPALSVADFTKLHLPMLSALQNTNS